MTFTEVLFAKRILVLAVLLASVVSYEAQCQMTQREMDNFKKLGKAREKRKKRGTTINTKKRLTSPKKTRQKKLLFSKKRYNLTYHVREDEFLSILV